MNYKIYQDICINFLKVGSVTNSSVLQIGSAGVIQARSNLYNTGGYVKPAEEAEPIPGGTEIEPVVPLASPT